MDKIVIKRRRTKKVSVGSVSIGGGAPVVLQSMTKKDTRDIEATSRQIKRLEEAGCQIIRVAVPDQKAAKALSEIKKRIKIPLVADIHFNWRLAILALENGADKIRINPGNIGSKNRVEAIVKAAQERRIPIRVGVNSGSLQKELLRKYGWPTAEALVESALKNVAMLEDLGFKDIIISLKSSEVSSTIEAYRMISQKVDYPLHVGMTATGASIEGIVKSTVAIGTILAEGIGDTIRVSLTGDPLEEVRLGFEILTSLGLREKGPTVISCPTCGRAQIDVVHLVEEVKRRLKGFNKPLRIAVMGCPVNGPGEAKEADFGIAGGRGTGLVFSHGRVIGKVKEEELPEALIEEIKRGITS